MLEPIKKHTSDRVFLSELAAGLCLGILLINGDLLAGSQIQKLQDKLYITCLITILSSIYFYQSEKPAVELLGSLLGNTATTALGVLLVTYTKMI